MLCRTWKRHSAIWNLQAKARLNSNALTDAIHPYQEATPTVISRQTTDFAINPFTRVVIDKHKSKIYLSAKEFDLLYFLYSHRGQVFSKEQLYENVWGYDDMPASSNLTSFIRKLRKKVEPDPNNPQYIITVWGVGYKFSEEKP